MGTSEQAPEDRLLETVEGVSADDRFAFERVVEMVQGALEIRRQAGTEGMSAEFSGSVDGVPYNVYLGPEQKEEQENG